jgi:hypothetical protein
MHPAQYIAKSQSYIFLNSSPPDRKKEGSKKDKENSISIGSSCCSKFLARKQNISA